MMRLALAFSGFLIYFIQAQLLPTIFHTNWLPNLILTIIVMITLFKGGKVWIKIFPDKPITAKPAGTRMGSGKGSPEYWVAVVKPGRVMFEMDGVPEATAREAMRLASHKLPIKCKFVVKGKELGGDVNEG